MKIRTDWKDVKGDLSKRGRGPVRAEGGLGHGAASSAHLDRCGEGLLTRVPAGLLVGRTAGSEA